MSKIILPAMIVMSLLLATSMGFAGTPQINTMLNETNTTNVTSNETLVIDDSASEALRIANNNAFIQRRQMECPAPKMDSCRWVTYVRKSASESLIFDRNKEYMLVCRGNFNVGAYTSGMKMTSSRGTQWTFSKWVLN